MVIFHIVRQFPTKVRDLVAPRYRPEKHYMRGFGPACARKAARH